MGAEHDKYLEGEFKVAKSSANGGEGISQFFDGKKSAYSKKEKELKTDSKKRKDSYQSLGKQSLKATLGAIGDMREAVKCPESESIEEWLAVNVVHFFNAATMVYGVCADYCTEESCPKMSAGKSFEYLWADGDKFKKPTCVPAPLYIEYLFNWIDNQISDPSMFPVEENAKFSSNFLKGCKKIFQRLFRLYAHIYFSHFKHIQEVAAEAHLNSCFKHFIYFVLEFKLVEHKELLALRKLIDKIIPDWEDEKKDEKFSKDGI